MVVSVSVGVVTFDGDVVRAPAMRVKSRAAIFEVLGVVPMAVTGRELLLKRVEVICDAVHEVRLQQAHW